MTLAELKAAGWEEYADGFSRGDWFILTGTFVIQTGRFPCYATIEHRPDERHGRTHGASLAMTVEQAINGLAKAKMPDGRAVRDWALSPP